MNTRTVPLEVADPQSAIRYLGEMQSRAMDPIHEPIQNLLEGGGANPNASKTQPLARALAMRVNV